MPMRFVTSTPAACVARGELVVGVIARAMAASTANVDPAPSTSRAGLFDGDARPPPETWGESASRLARVVRLSWSEALARLGIWRVDHVLALRMLSQRDMAGEIAREVASRGTRIAPDADGRLRAIGSAMREEDWEGKLREIKTALRYSKSLRRAPDLKTVARQGGVSRDDILLSDLAPQMLRPAYVLFKDDAAKRLIFVIRGTHSAKDMITNLTGSVCPHHTMGGDAGEDLRVGYAHSGFLTTAKFLERKIKDSLLSAMENNPGYQLKIVGHSLGGGVSVLLTEMLRQDARFRSAGLHCFTFACPSTLSRELAESCQSFVTTCVNNADLVPMVSFSKVTELQREVVSTALEQRLLEKWKKASQAAMATCARGPIPSRFAAAAAAVGKQNYGPQKYPKWLRTLEKMKQRHDKLVEASSLYRKSLLIGKRVSNTSSKLVSLSGAFIAGIVSPRPREKENAVIDRRAAKSLERTEFIKTNQQVGDVISAAVLATDICQDAHLAHANAHALTRTKEERDFEEFILNARIALDEDFQKPLTAGDKARIDKAEANAAQEVLALQEDISVMKAAEKFADDDLTMTADYYGADLPPPRMDEMSACEDAEYSPVIKRQKPLSKEDARRDKEKRGTVLLFPAGRILHFVHASGLGEGQDVEESPKPKSARRALFVDVDLDVYRKIILSRTMIADHFLAQYEDALDAFLASASPRKA